MKKKISALAVKTGLGHSEATLLAKTGIFGFIALMLCGALSACKGKTAETAQPPAQQPPAQNVQQSAAPAAQQQPAATAQPAAQQSTATAKAAEQVPVLTSTGSYTPPSFAKPWKNYPAGAKYNTVSPLDFAA